MKKLVSAHLPTHFGDFTVIAFESSEERMPHLALIQKDLLGEEGICKRSSGVRVRIHSECMTGDVFGSNRCECGEQLSRAMKILGSRETPGILLYLRQEGRGIGLVEKLRAYNLQDEGMDTFAANKALGHAEDSRNYSDAIVILRSLGVKDLQLMTNNPDKLTALSEAGFAVTRIPLEIEPKQDNVDYLKAKAKAGHFLTHLDVS